ncbi:MAG: sigma-54 dependent transcriptional regulator [Acidobacteriota bacterium]
MSEPAAILLIDDDDSLRRVVEYQLTSGGFRVTSRPSAELGLESLEDNEFDLVVTDLLMPGMSGLDFLDRARSRRPDTPVIVVTAHGDVATAVDAMQRGAVDFVEKPFTSERLLVSVRRALESAELRSENRRLRAIVQEHGAFENILGSSAPLRAALSDLSRAAATNATVLILGESGTGKELAARAVHLNSQRRQGPFVVVNCGAIPDNLLESELFGHRRGAFTGATEDRKGKFEQASKGTIFLDEVAELPLAMQPKLLRVLQEGEVDKLGATAPVRVDVRVIAATNRDLEDRVREGTFREDLWYRLNVIPIRMPSLRERADDIPVLVDHFAVKHARRHGKPVLRLEPEALEVLLGYDWPGNVRELENLIERLLVLGTSDVVTAANLPEGLRRDTPRFGGVRMELPPTGIVLEEVEKALIQGALARHQGNQSAAARFLGISRQTLLYRMQKFSLR